VLLLSSSVVSAWPLVSHAGHDVTASVTLSVLIYYWPKLDSKKSFGASKSNGLNWIAKNLLEQENQMA
jgi:hypothetical protein